ncbi:MULTISPECIES: TolB family protein [Saccharibacillus]|uniref:TolB family protein n=1 Tax=Saccharibacillus TaxID=456492 RepID=UPI0012399AD1|nr:PD40 domain-containing protein [Saccharibacillus sp. WB 17]MWJ33852.1 hypothetical protein [Saccharibacillus sp. WB 17]
MPSTVEKKTMRRAPVLLGILLALFAVGGCAGEEKVQVQGGAAMQPAASSSPAGAAQSSAEKPSASPSVTVRPNPNESVYSGLKLEKIDELEETLGGIWLGDGRILIQKPDPEAEPVWIGETQMPPYSLYIRDLGTGEEELLHGGDGKSWGAPLLSPDGKHLFLLDDSGVSGIPYLLDMESRKLTRIDTGTSGEYASSLDAGWLDNAHVAYAKEHNGGLYQSDLSGQETLLHEESGRTVLLNSLETAAGGDGRVYYGLSDTDWGMYVYDTAQSKRSEIGTSIPSLVPSPDDTQLAVIKRIDDTREQLLLTDPSGKEIKTLAEGKGFFGIGWSPDGKRLAYTVTSGRDTGKNGFYIADSATGQSFLLSPDLADAGDRMRWSPSGTKIMVTKSERLSGKLVSTTTIITVSW